MKTRLLPLLILALVVLSVAPIALADHCTTCKFGQCRPATTGGYWNCTSNGTTCTLSGACGGPHPVIEEPLAADFVVVSVERLDEPQNPTPSETRVASLETEAKPAPQTANR